MNLTVLNRSCKNKRQCHIHKHATNRYNVVSSSYLIFKNVYIKVQYIKIRIGPLGLSSLTVYGKRVCLQEHSEKCKHPDISDTKHIIGYGPTGLFVLLLYWVFIQAWQQMSINMFHKNETTLSLFQPNMNNVQGP